MHKLDIQLLNTDNEKIMDPSGLKTSLMEHQKTAIYAMSRMENDREVINDNFKIHTSWGILGDKGGSGKSSTILGLISHRPKINGDFGPWFGCNPFMSILKKDSLIYSPSNLVIVLHKKINIWEKYLSNTNLQWTKLNSSKLVTSIKIDEINKCNVTLLSNTMTKSFFQVHKNIKWNRIIIDDADTVELPAALNPSFNFLWLVSAFPQNLFRSNYFEEIDPKWQKKFVKNLVENLSFPTNMLGRLIVKNDDNYVEDSNKLPPYKNHTIICYTPYCFKIIKDFVPKQVLDLINSGNSEQAAKLLKFNINSEDNILNLFLENINHQITQHERMVKSKIKKCDDEKINESLQMIERLTNQKESIISKIKGPDNEICPICIGAFQKPIISSCCNSMYCLQCFTQMTVNNKTCALCRGDIDPRKIYLFSDKEEFKNTDLSKDKYQNLMEIIKLKKEKIIVYSDFEDTNSKISKLLNDNGVSHRSLKTGKPKNIIQEFTENKFRILLLNEKNLLYGIDLSAASTLIVFHGMEKDKLKNILAQVQRPGREVPLDIYYLLYEYENIYLDNPNLITQKITN